MGTFVKTETTKMSLTIHHYLPFLLLFMLVLSVVKSFLVSYAGKDFCLEKCKILSITMILAHLQLVFGIILFYKKSSEILDWSVVMSNTDSRYTFIEHPLMMLLAIILISVGRVKAKKIEDSKKSAKTIFFYFFIALILILVRTPFDKLLVF